MSGKFEDFIAENCAPPNAKTIGLYDSDSIKRGSIKLPSHMLYPEATKLYSFCVISDVHIAYETANEDFQTALTFAEKSDCLFTCICGDLTSTGTNEQFAQYKALVDRYAPTKPVYAVTGNHDSMVRPVSDNWISAYTGKPLYYSFSQGNDIFIMVGNYSCYDSENDKFISENKFTNEQLQWLYETLETNRNKRCFVFEHIFPWGDSGNANDIYSLNIWTGTKGTVFESLMKHYKNVTLFHGHSHLKFDLQKLDKTANYSNKHGYRSVHIPSLSVPRDIDNNSLTELYSESEGYIIDVFENCIVLRGRDFIDNGNDGVWLPIATYKIDTTLQTIEAGTYADSTGTIKT